MCWGRLKLNFAKTPEAGLDTTLATSVVPTSFKKSIIIPVPKNNKPSCLNDYRPVALTSTVMKVFERLLKNHICSSIPCYFGPSSVWIAQIDLLMMPSLRSCTLPSHTLTAKMATMSGCYSLTIAQLSIVPIKLAFKLTDLGLNSSLCDWIQDFLTGRPEVVKLGQFTSNSITLNSRSPTGLCPESPASTLSTPTTACPLTAPPLLLNLLMILWFWASSPTIMRPHLDEVERLTSWCQDNCLSLNVSKTKELIVDFRKRQQQPYTPLMISGTPVERVSSFKYIGVNISEDLAWTAHIQTHVKKARQRLYHLRQLRKFRVSPAILKTFYSGAIESVLTQCISVWYGKSSNQDCKALQRVVRLAERILGSALPSLQDIFPQSLQKQSC